MNLRMCAWGFAALFLIASCSGQKGPFREVRSWKFPDQQFAMAFYSASTDQDEATVRRAAEEIANELLQSHRDVRVAVLYDAAQARAVSSWKAMENMMKGGGTSANTLLYGGKKQGGGYLSLKKDGAPPEWVYVPLRDTAAASRNRMSPE